MSPNRLPTTPVLRAGCGLAALLAALPAGADGWSGSVGAVSDNVVYGMSRSGGQPAAVADVAYQSDTGWVLSAGGATLRRQQARGTAQASVAAGVGGLWAEPWSWQAAVVRYATLGGGAQRRPGYSEWVASVAWRGQLQLAVAVSPDYATAIYPGVVQRAASTHIELTGHQPLGHGVVLDLGWGRAGYRAAAPAGYGYGNLGLRWASGPLQLSAARIFSTSASPSVAGPRAVVSLLMNF